MSKARDLADRTAADLTAVTAGTGISITDGAGPIPTVTNTVATGFDAKGDLIVGTGADAFTTLTVASTADYYLVVDSATTSGLKWAAPAAGGGGLTSIASGSLSGSSLDLTSISGAYKHLQLVFRGATPLSDTTLIARLNNDSTGIYNYIQSGQVDASHSISSAVTATSFPVTNATGQNPQNGALILNVFDYANTTGEKQVTIQYNFLNNSGLVSNNWLVGGYRSTSAIDRITVVVGSGNWNSGTYELFGVK